MSFILNGIVDFVLSLLRPAPQPKLIPILIDRRDRRHGRR